ncbi:solute carrier family 47 member 4 isoform X3 [Alosa sapidissima]|uniref:solute carrier family 47 member 4 isoform X3 n=1 Tax=Alosa sapidissima TaxID=34773 RepID=UPI001C09D59A|nr:solute carrier family 47 member 4 isoform X3 [Alosa sapidissima]
MSVTGGSRAVGASSPDEPSAKLFCCGPLRRWVPLAIREELYYILRMTGPLMLYRVLNFLTPFFVTMFCGRLGNTVLAGYAMASVIISVSTLATGGGLILACNTLVSQTFGARNLLRVGVILQRSVLILLLFCLPCWALLVNSQAILLVLGQDPEVARIAQIYVIAVLPAVPAIFLHLLLVAYLQNQGVILPQVYMSAVAAVGTLLINYILVSWLDLGVPGSAAANSVAQIISCILLLSYIIWRKLHVKTWDGWTMECLQEWGSFMRLAIPSAFMFCLEWWVYEFGGFFAGMLSEDELAAQHVVMMLGFLNYMIPLSIQGAACVRVGNALGAGDTNGAIRTSKICLALTAVFAVFQGVILASTKSVIGFIFTSDEKIAKLVSGVLNVYCFSQFLDGLVCVSMGILLGAGRQRIAAVANLFGYYCIGLPVGIALMFTAGLRVAGFWLGLLICVCVQVTFFLTVIFKMNWKIITKEAVARAGVNVYADLMPRPEQLPLENNRETENGHGSVVLQEVQKAHGSERRQPAALLSPSQLLLRRGLSVLILLLILCVGVTVHFLLPLPESYWSSRTNGTMDAGNWTTANPLEQSTMLM